MNRFFNYLMIAFLLGVSVFVNANPVDMKDARTLGSKFIRVNTTMKEAYPDDLQHVITYMTDQNVPAFYVFNFNHGFVMVAADDCSTPILCYSDEGAFDPENLPPQMADYLEVYRKEIEYGIENQLSAEESIVRQWTGVKTQDSLFGKGVGTTVEPLLTSLWSQDCYYNALCPEDSTVNPNHCGHVVTGCVATSMAQLMHYWGYPATGLGSFSYTPYGYPTQSVNFGNTHYDWINMPDELSALSSPEEINAVATLMWHCGVSVGMGYGPNASGANVFDVPEALVNYFNYADEIVIQHKEDDATFLALIKGNLDMGWPVYYLASDPSQGGHAFICDGYNANNQLHFNWGWGGMGNGYYSLNALNIVNNYNQIIYQFNNDNSVFLNIHPQNLGPRYSISANMTPSEGGLVTGVGEYYEGRVCTLKAKPNDDYVFVNWTKDGEVVSTEFSIRFFVTGNATYTANFELFEGVTIGDGGSSNNDFLPSSSRWNYSLSEQIYTADEIGADGVISSVSFYNDGGEKTRYFDIFLTPTSKDVFYNYKDWVAVDAGNLVFSGKVTMQSGAWTPIVFQTPFVYDGSQNLVLVVDDNTNYYTLMSSMECRVFPTAQAQALRVFEDNVNYDPFNPSSYSGTMCYEKNQVRFTISGINSSGVVVNLNPGWNWISYTAFEEKSLEDALGVFVPEEGDVIKSQNAFCKYQNGQWLGSLKRFLPGIGYMYDSNRTGAMPFSFTSSSATSPEPINLQPGWNWISYTLFEEYGLDEALGSFEPLEGDVVKSQNAFSSFINGEWVGSLTHFTPGKGYMYSSNRTGTVPFSFAASPASPGYIDAVFTVNATGGQVRFSQGNLQYQASTNTWKFAEHQTDFVGAGNSNLSDSYSGWIDLFGWGTSGYNHGAYCYQPWSATQSNTDYYAYGWDQYHLYDNTGQADWGYNAISNGGNAVNSWRTLSVEEWDYVLNTRNTPSGLRYAKARVNGVSGVILLPDNWTSSAYSLNNANQAEAAYTENVINSTQWTSMEQAGVVFLPAAGRRYGTTVDDLGVRGHYWTSSRSSYPRFTYGLYISNYDFDNYFEHYRFFGKSVRLVQDVN